MYDKNRKDPSPKSSNKSSGKSDLKAEIARLCEVINERNAELDEKDSMIDQM